MSTEDSQPLITVNSGHSFREGEAFASYAEFLDKLERHSAHDLVYYWRRDSRTIQGSALRTARPLANAIRYSYVRLACIFGGQRYSSKSTGVRRKSTLRNDCPAFISLRASKCGRQLVVMELSNEHNHEVTEEANRTLAHNKKLSAEIKHEVKELLLNGVDRSLLIEYVRRKDGKVLSSKDVCNLAAAAKRDADSYEVGRGRKKRLEEGIKQYLEKALKVETDDQKTLRSEDDTGEMIEERLDEDFEESFPKVKTDLEVEEQCTEVQDEAPGNRQQQDSKEQLPELISRKRFRWRAVGCCSHRSNNRLVRAQVQLLRAKREKIIEETKLLRLKKRKLQMELDAMNKVVCGKYFG